MTPREAGFTLLEILVALAVLGFLMAGLAGAVGFGLRSYDSATRADAAHGDLDSIDRALSALIARMDPGTSVVAPRIVGEPASFAFTTDLPDGIADASTRHADVRLALDGAHRLVLSWTPHVHAVRFGPPPPPAEAVLLTGIDRLDLAYYGAATPQGRPSWLAEWRERRPPALVRIRVGFPPGDARHWPDLIAAPLRTQPP